MLFKMWGRTHTPNKTYSVLVFTSSNLARVIEFHEGSGEVEIGLGLPTVFTNNCWVWLQPKKKKEEEEIDGCGGWWGNSKFQFTITVLCACACAAVWYDIP